MAEKKETKAEAVVVEKNVDAFIARKMKAINEMASPAKAKKSAERVLWNRKVGK